MWGVFSQFPVNCETSSEVPATSKAVKQDQCDISSVCYFFLSFLFSSILFCFPFFPPLLLSNLFVTSAFHRMLISARVYVSFYLHLNMMKSSNLGLAFVYSPCQLYSLSNSQYLCSPSFCFRSPLYPLTSVFSSVFTYVW